ncbi:hypothetical protein HYFRA_00008262 [Hymenoscyphus fraxineus]|uniref:Uncharacterized protein n=1 Tax=Hymenoscyphus fraxineus TaxID=746836 RepID=A0A9N9LAJ7_9HELO|nr:hypothetical protein HYFRA_00008262 [Hymenoscyphus fraxineus]
MASNQRRKMRFEIGPDSEHDKNQGPTSSASLTRITSPSFSRPGRAHSILSQVQPITAPTIGNIGDDNIEYHAPNMEIDTTIQDDEEEEGGNYSQSAIRSSAGHNSQASTQVRGTGGQSASASESRAVTRRTITREINVPPVFTQIQSFDLSAPHSQFHGQQQHHQHHQHHQHYQHHSQNSEAHFHFQEMARRQLEFERLNAAEQAIQERWAQNQLTLQHEPCVKGFGWHRIEGGYACDGGSHIVTDELLIEGNGGYMLRNNRLIDGEWYGPLYSAEEAVRADFIIELNEAGLWWEGIDPDSDHPRIVHR